MFNAIRNKIAGLILLALPLALYGQAGGRQANQEIFGRIEHHFNLREADSIYQLSSPFFRKSNSLEKFRRIMEEELFPLGQIRASAMQFYDENRRIGFYQLELNGKGLLLELNIDGNMQFDVLSFKPHAPVSVSGQGDRQATGDRQEALMASLAKEYQEQAGIQSRLGIGLIDQRQSKTGYYGPTDKDTGKTPVFFDLGPASDLFTATLLAFMATADLVDLQAPIASYLPDSIRLRPDLAAVTLQHLANHTSGLSRLPQDWKRQDSIGRFWEYLQQYPEPLVPDSMYLPSDAGYRLLEIILAHVGGKSVGEMVYDYILLPLGMENTAFIPVEEGILSGLRINTTLEDMMRFARAHFDLPETYIQYALTLTRQFTFFDPPETDIGLGWLMQLRANNLVYWHEAAGSTGSMYISLDPDRKKAVVILSDSPVPVDKTGQRLIDSLVAGK